MGDIKKKRHLLPKLKSLIMELSSMSEDVAKLEIDDNEAVSLKMRKRLINFKNRSVTDFYNEITNIRVDINTNKGRNIVRPKKLTEDAVSQNKIIN